MNLDRPVKPSNPENAGLSGSDYASQLHPLAAWLCAEQTLKAPAQGLLILRALGCSVGLPRGPTPFTTCPEGMHETSPASERRVLGLFISSHKFDADKKDKYCMGLGPTWLREGLIYASTPQLRLERDSSRTFPSLSKQFNFVHTADEDACTANDAGDAEGDCNVGNAEDVRDVKDAGDVVKMLGMSRMLEMLGDVQQRRGSQIIVENQCQECTEVGKAKDPRPIATPGCLYKLLPQPRAISR